MVDVEVLLVVEDVEEDDVVGYVHVLVVVLPLLLL